MASVKRWCENRILSRVIRWLNQVEMVEIINSTVSVSSPSADGLGRGRRRQDLKPGRGRRGTWRRATSGAPT
eukprot:7502551-Pyramimonas_sp.AAC.1